MKERSFERVPYKSAHSGCHILNDTCLSGTYNCCHGYRSADVSYEGVLSLRQLVPSEAEAILLSEGLKIINHSLDERGRLYLFILSIVP